MNLLRTAWARLQSPGFHRASLYAQVDLAPSTVLYSCGGNELFCLFPNLEKLKTFRLEAGLLCKIGIYDEKQKIKDNPPGWTG